MVKQMKSRNVLVSMIALFATVFLLASSVSAVTITNPTEVFVFVDGSPSLNAIDALGDGKLSVTPGEAISIKVVFTAADDGDHSKVSVYEDVRVEVEINGDDEDGEAETEKFDAIEGATYKKTLRVVVPDDLDEELDSTYHLEVTIHNKDDSVRVDFPLTVQRENSKFEVIAIN